MDGQNNNDYRKAPLYEPDTWAAPEENWVEVPQRARFVLRKLQEWNEYYGAGTHNHYSRPEVQSFTLVKTLPNQDPWIKFKWNYYQMLSLYAPNFTLMCMDSTFKIEDIDKGAIRWGIPVEELLRQFEEVDRKGREDGTIITFQEWREKSISGRSEKEMLVRLAQADQPVRMVEVKAEVEEDEEEKARQGKKPRMRASEYRRYWQGRASRANEASSSRLRIKREETETETETEEDDIEKDPDYFAPASSTSSSDSGYAWENYRLD